MTDRKARHMPSPRLLALGAAATVLLSTTVVGMPAAEAKVRTSTGLTCTRVGTPYADRIVGTSRRDVICGGGGNDVISGGGGDDVIDGGAGNDSLSGGTGNDTIVGASGNDVIDSGAGNDSIDAGVGNDRVQGGAGNDRVQGGTGNDRLAGSDGNDAVGGGDGVDVIDAGAGNDVVNAGVGNDQVQGGTGNDHLAGSGGNDTISGSNGIDLLQGNDGNDDLNGGAGVDVVDGGAGTNWCDISSDDRQSSCVRDAQPPVNLDTRISATSVDVTQAAVPVTVLVHASDDTGVQTVSVSAYATSTGHTLDSWYGVRRVSGDVRDGWYRVAMTMPRYLATTAVSIQVQVFDRVGRQAGPVERGLQVVGNDPDLDPPQLLASSVSRSSIDVRKGMDLVTLRAHLRDAKSGVEEVLACPYRPTPSGFEPGDNCQFLPRASGTDRDGWWQSDWFVPRGALSGTWDIRFCTLDRSHQTDRQCWIGPGEAAYAAVNGLEPAGPPQPAPGAVLNVRGTDGDITPPVLTSVTFSPAEVDASTGARTAHIDVAARDVEGIMHVRAGLIAEDDSSRGLGTTYEGQLTSGTHQNGVWRFDVEIAGGTPVGDYWVQTTLEDNAHRLVWQPARHLVTGDMFRAYTADQTPVGDSLVVR